METAEAEHLSDEPSIGGGVEEKEWMRVVSQQGVREYNKTRNSSLISSSILISIHNVSVHCNVIVYTVLLPKYQFKFLFPDSN
jgi:hypothetical protein